MWGQKQCCETREWKTFVELVVELANYLFVTVQPVRSFNWILVSQLMWNCINYGTTNKIAFAQQAYHMWNMQRIFYWCNHSYRVFAHMWVSSFEIDSATLIFAIIWQFLPISVCKSCLVKHLEENNTCPRCGNVIHQSHPLQYISFDRTMQDIVYKLVPNLQMGKSQSLNYTVNWIILTGHSLLNRWNETWTRLLQKPQFAKSKRSTTQSRRRCIRSVEWNACRIRLSSARWTG